MTRARQHRDGAREREGDVLPGSPLSAQHEPGGPYYFKTFATNFEAEADSILMMMVRRQAEQPGGRQCAAEPRSDDDDSAHGSSKHGITLLATRSDLSSIGLVLGLEKLGVVPRAGVDPRPPVLEAKR